MEFQEEYWPEALKTLRREERKAFVKRWIPWLGVLLLLLGGAAILLQPEVETAYSAIPVHAMHGAHQEALYPVVTPAASSVEVSQPYSQTQTQRALPSEYRASSDPHTDETTDPTQDLSAQEVETNLTTDSAPALASQQTSQEEPQATPQTPQPNLQGRSEEASSVSTPQGGVSPASPGVPANPALLRSSVLNGDERSDAQGGKTDNDAVEPFYTGLPMKMRPQAAVGLSLVRKKPAGRDQEFPGRMFEWKQNHFFLTVGNSFATGFGSRNGDVLLDPEVGIGYERLFIDPHWSGRASLNYFSIGGITHSADFAQQELGFGLTTTLTSISTERLHFAFLPLEINYNPTKRSTFTGGLGLSYLINSLSEVTVSEITHQNSQELDRFEEWGYVGGYKSVNASLLAGYEFRFTPNLWLGGQYQYGLTKITKESIYGQQKDDRNSRLRLYIKYALQW